MINTEWLTECERQQVQVVKYHLDGTKETVSLAVALGSLSGHEDYRRFVTTGRGSNAYGIFEVVAESVPTAARNRMPPGLSALKTCEGEIRFHVQEVVNALEHRVPYAVNAALDWIVRECQEMVRRVEIMRKELKERSEER
jgi:hypothetical protein